MSVKKFGIDISRWQGDFDLQAAKNEGVEFVVVKGAGGDAAKGTGLYVDSKFERNYSECKRLGLPVGAYFFSRALTVDKARTEAEYFYNNCLAGKQFELPVWYDIEHQDQLNLGKRLLTDIAIAFCSYLEKRGYWVGIYSSQSYFASFMFDAELQRYAHWIANWSKACTYPAKEVLGLWQFGGSTNKIRTNIVAGAVCDQNYMYVDYPAIIPATGLNGFTKAPEPPALKSIEEIAREVLSGVWGNGTDRVQRLTAAGYDPNAVQAAVNKIMASNKPTTTLPIAPVPAAPKAGDVFNLTARPLYVSATAKMSLRKLTGTYYLYDGIKVNGRYRVTNSKSRVNKTPAAFNVTGWIAL